MRLLLASNNRHKLHEIAILLAPHRIQLPSDIGVEFSHDENEDTFLENAGGKAMHLYNITGQPTLADDSGLMVDALGGVPGVHTARYGEDIFNRELTSVEKYMYLLEEMKHVRQPDRSARFVCTLALVLSQDRIFTVQETVEGSIAEQPFGLGGFGYDPVFIVHGGTRTMAAMTDSEKNHLSHRGRAARRMLAIIQSVESEEQFYVC